MKTVVVMIILLFLTACQTASKVVEKVSDKKAEVAELREEVSKKALQADIDSLCQRNANDVVEKFGEDLNAYFTICKKSKYEVYQRDIK